jgi:hypothetical protein
MDYGDTPIKLRMKRQPDGMDVVEEVVASPEELVKLGEAMAAWETQTMDQTLPVRVKPSMRSPSYRQGFRYGNWKLVVVPPVPIPGYWSKMAMALDNVVLQQRDVRGKWRTWMSLTPMERESQAIPVIWGEGRVVVMGLGMGVVAYNAALNPKITEVIVVERDPAVIKLMDRALVKDATPEDKAAWAKVRIVPGDALTWKPPGPVDVLYADIWLHLGSDEALPETQQMQRNIQARKVYYWGQELDALAMLFNEGRRPPTSWQDWDDFVAKAALPLMGREVPDYPTLMMRVALNMMHTATTKD